MTELIFKGKEFVYNHHLAVPIRPLEMHPDKGIGDPSLDGVRRHIFMDTPRDYLTEYSDPSCF